MLRALAVLLLAVSVWAAQPVRARHGMVVTREPHATSAGLEVLKSGGNAIDAAVAVGFVLAVTHPSAGNIGGGGFMLIRFAGGGATFLDFRERAPMAASRNMYIDPATGKATQDSVLGYRAAGVPGTVRGLEYASRKYGRKPWAALVHPAVALAANGFPVSWAQARSFRASRDLARFPESQRIFLNGGKFYEPGDLLVQSDLAR
ncbi:MAG: gamma-glutamyltransferase, partial [Acidobacteriota bacterium]|nr:gamma-glutamyltransferase [Acidobacteriota bacterium]